MPTIAGWFSCGYDAVLVVDESDAGPRAEDGSRFVLGRLLSASDHRKIVRLEHVLQQAQAETWHASGRSPDLFQSATFARLLRMITALDDPAAVEMRVTPSEIEAIRHKYGDALRAQPELRRTWRAETRASTEELILFRYLAMAPFVVFKDAIDRGLSRRRLLIVCDRQPFITGRGATDFATVPTWDARAARSHGLDIDVLCIVAKDHPEVQPALRLVGLVDSELWALRRLLSRRAADGRTLDAMYRDWAARGRPEDEAVLQQGMLDDAFASRDALAEYIERVTVPMVQRGRVLLVRDEL